MKKIRGVICGSSMSTETIVDGAVVGLVKMFFTAEEKSEANAKLGEWYLKYLEATQPQNLARRFIAIIVVVLWALLILAGARAVDWILPKGWHLKIVHRWAEKNDDTKEITDED